MPTETVKLRRKLYAKVANAKRLGILIPKKCEVQGCSKTKVEAHHPDYSQPLKVKWLCKYHHYSHHRKLKFQPENWKKELLLRESLRRRFMKYNTDLQRAIIKEWKKTKVVHPSLSEIATKVGCNKQTVFKIVARYKQLKVGH